MRLEWWERLLYAAWVAELVALACYALAELAHDVPQGVTAVLVLVLLWGAITAERRSQVKDQEAFDRGWTKGRRDLQEWHEAQEQEAQNSPS